MNSIKSLERAIDILFSFSRNKPEQTPLEIAEAVEIPVPSVYRFLHTFVKKGLLEQNKRTGMYSLGFDLLQLEAALRNKMGLEQIMRPAIEQVASLTQETVQITILNKDHGLLMFSEDSPNPPRFVPEFGIPIPLYAGSTVQAIMAFVSEKLQEKIISGGIRKIGPKSILSPAELRARLKEIRDSGYAVSYEEYYPGSLGIATPLILTGNRIFGSIAVSGPIDRLEPKKEDVIRLLTEQAEILSERISIQEGYGQKVST